MTCASRRPASRPSCGRGRRHADRDDDTSTCRCTCRAGSSGKVTQIDGVTPIAGAAVSVYAGPLKKGSAATNASGDYTIAALHPGCLHRAGGQRRQPHERTGRRRRRERHDDEELQPRRRAGRLRALFLRRARPPGAGDRSIGRRRHLSLRCGRQHHRDRAARRGHGERERLRAGEWSERRER